MLEIYLFFNNYIIPPLSLLITIVTMIVAFRTSRQLPEQIKRFDLSSNSASIKRKFNALIKNIENLDPSVPNQEAIMRIRTELSKLESSCYFYSREFSEIFKTLEQFIANPDHSLQSKLIHKLVMLEGQLKIRSHHQ